MESGGEIFSKNPPIPGYRDPEAATDIKSKQKCARRQPEVVPETMPDPSPVNDLPAEAVKPKLKYTRRSPEAASSPPPLDDPPAPEAFLDDDKLRELIAAAKELYKAMCEIDRPMARVIIKSLLYSNP